jgi:hypothetical protein
MSTLHNYAWNEHDHIGMTGRRQLLRVIGMCARRGFCPHALVGGGERLWHPPQGAPGGRGPSGLPAAQRPARCAGRWTLGRGSECADAKTREWRCGSGVTEIPTKARLIFPAIAGLMPRGRPVHAAYRSRRSSVLWRSAVARRGSGDHSARTRESTAYRCAQVFLGLGTS